MICGINPGRYGAGETGIPFLDSKSLYDMGFDVKSNGSERSAEFFYEVVKEFGMEDFFKTFYVTNIASVGFTKNNKNLNYYELPVQALKAVLSNFSEELNAVNPTKVIALSVAAQNTLKNQIKFKSNCISRLPHPSWIMTYRHKDKEKWINKYLDELNKASLVN